MKLNLSALIFTAFSSVCLSLGATVDIAVTLTESNPAAKIDLNVNNFSNYSLLASSNGNYILATNDGGKTFGYSTDIDGSRFATLYYNNVPTQLWLTPDAKISVTLGSDSAPVKIEGDNSEINTYLNKAPYKFAGINDTGRDEEDFLNYTDSVNNANLAILTAANLPADFKAMEADRIFFENALALSFYPEFHPRLKKDSTYRASEKFYDRLKAATRYEAPLLASRQYTDYIINTLSLLSSHEVKGRKGFDRFTTYLDSCVVDPKVKEYIFDRYATSRLKRHGIEGAKDYIDAYPRYVTDSKINAKFQDLYKEILSISPGQPSPAFDCETPDGSRRTLADYAGKWVYIDIWATWCGPCRREIPHLRKLEEKYAGQPIVFVSISVDEDRDAWKSLVEKQKMEGEQLHFDGKDKFCDSYKVAGIPRFILIDPEGRIVDPDMTRPSDPATAAAFDKLLKL